MKLIGALGLFAASACAASPKTDFEWLTWKNHHKRNYQTASEENLRYLTFNANRQFVQQHNARAANGYETYTVSLNKFADMDHKEFSDLYLSQVRDYSDKSIVLEYACPVAFAYDGSTVPSSKSYSPASGASDIRVTSMKDQGQCGSCWSFGTGAAVEAAVCAAGTKDCTSWQGVSTQQQVDCGSWTAGTSVDLNPYDNHGCSGGFQSNALRYVMMQGGLMEWTDYGYVSGNTQTEGTCKFDSSKYLSTISNCGAPASGDETQMMQAISQVGPLTVAIDASGMGFQMYSGGVYVNTRCSTTRLNHAVTATGYGSSAGDNYWEVKNSWGTGWGAAGYIWMARDQGNMCGIATDSQYAIV